MICPFLPAPRRTLAALFLAASGVALSGCSSTDTSAAVKPFAKHVSGSPSFTFTFQKVDDGTNTAVTGISDSQEIVGTYCLSACTTSKAITQSFTSTPNGSGVYGTFVGDNYPQPIDTGDTDTSTYLVAINPGKVATSNTVEAGWAVQPAGLFFTLALINNQGLWSVFHTFPSGGEDGLSLCKVMELSGINDSYDAVGYYTKHNGKTSQCKNSSRVDQAFEASPGEGFQEIQLGSEYGSSVATGIADTASKVTRVVGWAIPSGSSQMVGWSKSSYTGTGGVTKITIPSAPTAPVQALGINAAGTTVVGSYTVSGKTYGFLCDWPCSSTSSFQTGIKECDSCATVVYGINDSNEICGYYIGVDGHQHGFVATSNSLRRRAARPS